MPGVLILWSLPPVSEIDALIVMGGSMGVYDDDKFPWLEEEKMFIQDGIKAGKKVLGICLGAQLMAVCMGARVNIAANKEIGWFKVRPTVQSEKISWLYELFQDKPTVFHWHGDQFEIPCDGSFSFLGSEANDHQALYHSDQVIALQFHLEVTEQTLDSMLEHCRHELTDLPYIQTERDIRNGTQYIRQCNEMMGKILGKWLGYDK